MTPQINFHNMLIVPHTFSTDAWYTYKYADRWGKKEPRCNGLNQSPIIVNPLYLYSFGTESTIKFLGYKKKPKSMTLKNTGRTGNSEKIFTLILKEGYK